MGRFIFFTKTIWSEPPRLRHQLAFLLVKNGNTVVFFEKPYSLFQKRVKTRKTSQKIILFRTRQLINHKLRFNKLLRYVNATYEKKSINKYLREVKVVSNDVIINFNYDYFFLKDILPSNKIITIINDNFWSRAIFNFQLPLISALRLTCTSSDSIVAVSKPLVLDIINLTGRHCSIFTSWSDSPYVQPTNNTIRDTILFWGYIGDKIDWKYVDSLALYLLNHRIKIKFIGPCFYKPNFIKKTTHSNIFFEGPTSFENLFLDSVFACFIPYHSEDEECNAITMPNKVLRLLSRGLPILFTGMPFFEPHSFSFRLKKNIPRDLETILSVRRMFWNLQPAIEMVVNSRQSDQALNNFNRLINEV